MNKSKNFVVASIMSLLLHRLTPRIYNKRIIAAVISIHSRDLLFINLRIPQIS